MNNINPQAEAVAYRRAMAKIVKIKDLEITADFTEEQTNATIKFLAEKKEEETGKPWTEFVRGQRWYVEDLVKFAGLDAKDKLEYEYAQAFPDVATTEEKLSLLEAAMS